MVVGGFRGCKRLRLWSSLLRRRSGYSVHMALWQMRKYEDVDVIRKDSLMAPKN